MKRPPASMHFMLPNNRRNKSSQPTKNQTQNHTTRKQRTIKKLGLGLLVLAFFVLPSMRINVASGVSVNAFDESISTFASSDCATPKSTWNLGQTACATATGSPDDRRIAWVAPNGAVAQVSNFYSGTLSDSYSIPTGTDRFAQVGTWTVEIIDPSGVASAAAEFVVTDPGNASVDLAIGKFGPTQATPGSNLNFRVEVINRGPNDAQNVVISDPVPAGTTFVSETQNSGPAFTCVSPAVGSGAGTVSCTIATLPPNTVVVFSIAFNVGSGTPDGTVITNVASVSSDTNELNVTNNSASASTAIFAASTQCSLNCPPNITQDNDTNACSAVVTYSTPTTSGSCGAPPESNVVCNPPSGSTFPIGDTPVTCATLSGGSCSFTVTVHDTRPPVQPTILCPGNLSVGESSPDSGEATVNYAAPTTTGNCVTTVCTPPSGSSFRLGTTTVNCKATDSAGNEVTCSFTVTVSNGSACSISCPPDVMATAPSGECSALVTYAAPTTSGVCGTVSCSPASGTLFGVGTTTVTCSTTEGPGCSFLVTVIAAAPPTITTCATNKAVPADANCEGVIPNLIGEVVATGCNVTISQSPAAGSVVAAGVYTVTITAENSAGQATCTATVRVDNQAPVITCPSNIVVSLPLNSTATSMVVNYAAATATDNCGTPTVTSTPASGSVFPVGVTTVTATANDGFGNTSSCSFTVTVLYNFTGFFSPVGNPPVLNTVNAGRAIPVKFSLSGNKSLNIFATGSPVSGQITCDASAPPSEVVETLTAGSSTLSYDASSDQYTYVWKTESSWAGTCRQLIVTLNDGSQHVANFKFR